ncbi:hypothetical protein BJY00DRAFT_283965 [Aspergillus carlsbadensis]|nr:hypothetical protein BJY00DRAFT_283965 [Aspergillus carlsbadensis]
MAGLVIASYDIDYLVRFFLVHSTLKYIYLVFTSALFKICINPRPTEISRANHASECCICISPGKSVIIIAVIPPSDDRTKGGQRVHLLMSPRGVRAIVVGDPHTFWCNEGAADVGRQ